jgi:hypothetical protein
MARADSNNSTIDPSRRRFVTIAAAASAVSATALAAAAMPVHQACTASQDDSGLIKLEEQIFEQYWAAHAYDDELVRLCDIWIAENRRLADEVNEGRSALGPQERWALVTAMPETKEHDRLVKLQDEPFARMNALIDQMFATPAHTPEGRRAKVLVLLRCIMGCDWCHVDAETDYPEQMARNLLIELIGGSPGEQLRGQFA